MQGIYPPFIRGINSLNVDLGRNPIITPRLHTDDYGFPEREGERDIFDTIEEAWNMAMTTYMAPKFDELTEKLKNDEELALQVHDYIITLSEEDDTEATDEYQENVVDTLILDTISSDPRER